MALGQRIFGGTSWRWITAGILVAALFASSSASSTWLRFDDALKERIDFLAYAASIYASYLSWIGIVVIISAIRRRLPMFSKEIPLWWAIHGALSLVIGLGHMAFDTLLLWLTFDQSFIYFIGLAEKLMQWLPFEILAYWACLGILTLINKQKAQSTKAYLSRFVVNSGDSTQLIAANDVDWIESFDNYVLLWKGSEKFLVRQTMSSLESTLDPARFNRIHRKVIVNLREADKLVRSSNGGTLLQLKGGTQVPVSRRRKAQFKQVLHDGTGSSP